MTRPLTMLLMALLAGCGVSPRVRVERAPADAVPVVARASPHSPRPTAAATADRHVVVRGDTLYSIAFRNGIDVRDLIAWNRLSPPFTIFPGQALTLRGGAQASVASSSSSVPSAAPPRPSATTPVPAATRPPASTALGTHAVVEDGGPVRVESLDGGTSSAAPRTTTGSVMPAPRPPGALIAAIGAPPAPTPAGTPRPSPGYRAPPAMTTAAPPVGTRPATAAPVSSPPPATESTNTTAASTASSVPAAMAAAHPSNAATPASAGSVSTAAVDPNAPTTQREGIRWRWPSSGNVIGRFVSGDPTQQGIDIAGRLGQPVVAVADGEVVYSGNGLLGYGEMIIVQHSPDYLSAYGHNQRRLLTEGTRVKAGQVIAEMGQRGSQVMLHFEVRRRGKPVDPLAYLPPR